MASDNKTKQPPENSGGKSRGGADGKAKEPEPKSKTESAGDRSKEVARKL